MTLEENPPAFTKVDVETPLGTSGMRGARNVMNYVVGNLFESPAKVLVNTVNTVGVMGKGIAKEFKRIYPEMFRQYQALCEARLFDVGQLWLYKTPHKWILNFPTKRHWRQPSKVEYIEAGLKKFVETYSEKGITSIAFPMLGCGNGELDWETQVRPLMESYLKNELVDVFVYLYHRDAFIPEHRNADEIAAWLRSEPASLAFAEFMDDLQVLLSRQDEFVLPNGRNRFRCYIVRDKDEQPVLKIEGDGWVDFVENWQLLDLWQNVTAAGFFTGLTVPGGLEHVVTYMQVVFSELPYFKWVLYSSDYKELGEHSAALQLVAPVRSSLERTVLPEMVTSYGGSKKES